MTPADDTHARVRVVQADPMDESSQIIKIAVPKVKLHGAQFWGIVAGILSAAAIIAALMGAFFVSKSEAAGVHGEINQKLGEHIAVDNARDKVQDEEQKTMRIQMKAIEHNVIKIGERVRARGLKTADDFGEQ